MGVLGRTQHTGKKQDKTNEFQALHRNNIDWPRLKTVSPSDPTPSTIQT
jgi:hypothetical protein